MKREELETSNRSKYGDKKNYLISRMYKHAQIVGHAFALGNAERYLDRFGREGSSKSLNATDLVKAKDFIERVIKQTHSPNKLEDLSYFSTRTQATAQDCSKDAIVLINKFIHTSVYAFSDNVQLLVQAYCIIESIERKFKDTLVNNEIIE